MNTPSGKRPSGVLTSLGPYVAVADWDIVTSCEACGAERKLAQAVVDLDDELETVYFWRHCGVPVSLATVRRPGEIEMGRFTPTEDPPWALTT
jgi:hypothetical protein